MEPAQQVRDRTPPNELVKTELLPQDLLDQIVEGGDMRRQVDDVPIVVNIKWLQQMVTHVQYLRAQAERYTII